MFERNKHGQLVYIPTVERIARELGWTIDCVAGAASRTYHMVNGSHVYRDNERMILPTRHENFRFKHLRAQDNPPARLKSDRKVEK